MWETSLGSPQQHPVAISALRESPSSAPVIRAHAHASSKYFGGGVGQPVVRGKVFPVFPDECSGHERNLRAAATLRQPTPHPTPPLTRR